MLGKNFFALLACTLIIAGCGKRPKPPSLEETTANTMEKSGWLVRKNPITMEYQVHVGGSIQSPSDFELLSRIQVAELYLTDTNITDSELRLLWPLTNLRELYLSGTQITDDGLLDIVVHRKLEILAVTKTRVRRRAKLNCSIRLV
jgi:Leucine-rich repeat (LRR) protein